MSHNVSRVFVVDDEQVIAETLTIILRHEGFDAEFFTHPLEALATARERAPDLLISDVMMPNCSGIELAIRFREACPRCSIILFSGQATTLDLLEDARAKEYNFALIQKPVYPTDLLRMIHDIVTEKSIRPQAANRLDTAS